MDNTQNDGISPAWNLTQPLMQGVKLHWDVGEASEKTAQPQPKDHEPASPA